MTQQQEQNAQVWTDNQIEAEVRRIGDNMRLYISDACAIAEKVRDDYEQALAAADAAYKELAGLLAATEAERDSLRARLGELEAAGEWEPVPDVGHWDEDGIAKINVTRMPSGKTWVQIVDEDGRANCVWPRNWDIVRRRPPQGTVSGGAG